MGKSIWELILRLFGKEKSLDRGALQENKAYTGEYEDIGQVNFTAIFANKLSTLALCESNVDVVGRGKREALLDECVQELWGQMKKITAGMLGTGGYGVVPYVKGGRIAFDLVPQERMVITQKEGRLITGATILADSRKDGERTYYRWVDYRVERGVLYITNRVTDSGGRIGAHEDWAELRDHAIGGVEGVLFAYFKSPMDSRRSGEVYGVPITYGCQGLIGEIHQCLEEIREEFSLKQVRIFADERLFKRDEGTGRRVMPSKAFVSGNLEGSNGMMEVFSPELRHSSYYARLLELFTLLERAVGTSRGILTAPESRGATATEIKAGLYDTFSMVMDIRRAIERGVREYIKACDVLMNYYDLAPTGGYDVVFDWDYSLVENSGERWAQMKEAIALGIRSKAEGRQWLCTNETLEEAERKVAAMAGMAEAEGQAQEKGQEKGQEKKKDLGAPPQRPARVSP